MWRFFSLCIMVLFVRYGCSNRTSLWMAFILILYHNNIVYIYYKIFVCLHGWHMTELTLDWMIWEVCNGFQMIIQAHCGCRWLIVAYDWKSRWKFKRIADKNTRINSGKGSLFTLEFPAHGNNNILLEFCQPNTLADQKIFYACTNIRRGHHSPLIELQSTKLFAWVCMCVCCV